MTLAVCPLCTSLIALDDQPTTDALLVLAHVQDEHPDDGSDELEVEVLR